jgi:serine/threonine-protein kinase
MEMSSEARQGAFVRIVPDLPASVDNDPIFESGDAARKLAELAWNPARQTPFLVARRDRAQAGAGLLRQTRRLLEGARPRVGARKVRTLRFNAWKLPDDDSVLVGLLGTLLSQFRRGHLIERLRFQVDGSHTELARLLLHAAAPWAFARPPEQASIPAIDERLVCGDLFRDLFQQGVCLLCEGSATLGDGSSAGAQALWLEQLQREHNLAIFVEDLERCHQERLLETMEAIGLLLDLPGMSFYLGLDEDRMRNLLAQHLAGYREMFLEKWLESSPPARPAPVVVAARQQQSKPSAEPFFTQIEWLWIPAGSFRMGSEQGRDNERPVHSLELSGFHIARYPVTNAQYARYVSAGQVPPPAHWRHGKIPEGRENHPVVFVSWRDALGYCDWLSEQMAEQGRQGRVRLPSEAQWEYAARGSEGREYPWGNKAPDRELCNYNNYVNDTTPVGAYPKGASPEGVHDLAGNVWEWTRSKWEPYPYPSAERKRDRLEGFSGDEHRVLRGCSFRYGAWYVRSACRGKSHPDGRHSRVGFRVVMTTS